MAIFLRRRSGPEVLAVDTNVLVYAHRADAPLHASAKKSVRDLAESPAPWAIPWPSLHEFYSVVTHPRIYGPPSTPDQALTQIDAWLGSPSLVLLSESSQHWPTLAELLRTAQVAGPMVHDARIAALCLQHGVREILTLDRDFGRFPALQPRSLLA